MDKNIVEFAKRMDAADDKETLISFCKGAKNVLDLGAGTGAMARQIFAIYGANVDAVDKDFKKENCPKNKYIKYIKMPIADFLKEPKKDDKKYDCIILSGVLHELNEDDLQAIKMYLPNLMARNSRIIIREPLYDENLGPVLPNNSKQFIDLVSNNVSVQKAFEYRDASKISEENNFGAVFITYRNSYNSTFYANLAFVFSYGEDSWEREKHEYRYARSIEWAKDFFDFHHKPFTGLQIYPVKDMTYRQHFINAGIPGEAFDLIQYTGLHIIIDYSRGEQLNESNRARH